MPVRAIYLAILQTLFLGRVLGQITAELAAPPWLPSGEHWQSGLLPYPLLLAVQILILMFMSLVTYDACRRNGLWHVQKQKTKKILRRIACGYMAAMALRYVLTMALLPELRWFGHTIPITFHFVLASYILILGLPAERQTWRRSTEVPMTQGSTPGKPADADKPLTSSPGACPERDFSLSVSA